jgi:ABC-2 type transport system ATP-binding protein
LRDVNLTLQKGQIYGLLGPNGAGKSTTISVVTGLRTPTSGSVRVLGLDPAVDALHLHSHIGVLAEQAGFYDWMSAGNYLRWIARLYQKNLGQTEIIRLLDRVGLEGKNPAPIATYSRGMRQRLGLARALVNQPELLILDEPTNGLDPRGRREIHDVLLDLSANQGVGILLCTHLLDDVDRLCTRIGIIAQGRTLLEGSIADLLSEQRAAVRYRLRMEPGEAAERLPAGIALLARTGDWWHVEITSRMAPASAWRALLDAGLRVDEIRREGGGLEELYLSVTEAKEAA